MTTVNAHLVRLLDWEEAHVGFEKAVTGIPADKRGARADGFEHSLWQLLEHMRIAQKDILNFCLNDKYVHALEWPSDYWPKLPDPPDVSAWEASIADFKADRERLKELAGGSQRDLLTLVPTGTGRQTFLRAILLAADHNAYHLGQLVAVRRALGIWP
jgi:uncharacterized damage-inducible protein DinB